MASSDVSTDRYSAWIYLLALPWFVIMYSYLLLGESYWQNAENFWGASLLTAALLAATFFVQGQVAARSTQQLPRLEQAAARVAWSFLAHVVLSAVSLGLIAGLFSCFPFTSRLLSPALLFKLYWVNLIAGALVVGFHETMYSVGQWQLQQLARETLKRENLSGQLQSLKSQISPHFLFNSFNSLSSLIADEPEKAERFITEMAQVYRYLLQTGAHGPEDDSLISLEQELAFINSYAHLLETRHGAGMRLLVEVAPQYRQHRLPPLVLQLLVENAVKHNVLLPSRPLHITIATTPDGCLQVRNNLQPKIARSTRLESTRIGLANIRQRYQLLDQPEPLVEVTASHFTVTLPLLGPLISVA